MNTDSSTSLLIKLRGHVTASLTAACDPTVPVPCQLCLRCPQPSSLPAYLERFLTTVAGSSLVIIDHADDDVLSKVSSRVIGSLRRARLTIPS